MVKKLWRYVKMFSSDTGTLWTDGQTDRFAISVSRVSMLMRDKKEWTDFNENWHISSPKARAWTIDLEGQEVKVSDTGGRSYIWKSGGDIILNPLSRVDRGIQWATEILPLKRGPWVLNIVLTAPPAYSGLCVLVTHLLLLRATIAVAKVLWTCYASPEEIPELQRPRRATGNRRNL